MSVYTKPNSNQRLTALDTTSTNHLRELGAVTLGVTLNTLNKAKDIVEQEKKILKQADKDKTSYTASKKAAETAGNAVEAAKYAALLAKVEKTKTEHTTKLNDANTKVSAAQAEYDKLLSKYVKGETLAATPAKPKAPGNPNGNPNPTPTPILYHYNAPMVKHAYTQRGVQVASAGFDKLITNPGSYDDAAKAWGTNAGAKGTIQMSRFFADAANKTNKPTNKNTSQKFDDKLYGFKFLYNPTSINMAWGIVEQFSPQFEASGSDKANVLSVGLMKSAITFSLMLNRIGDMALLDKTGIKSNVNSQNPYPSTVSPEDAKLIYKRGTMYDLEYLFRSTGGYSSQYKSQMMHDYTADKGWLNPIPVELHLGDGLRYLVRVSSLDVNHIIFNERMVPLLTSVNITCTRYFDGPEMFQASEVSSALRATPAPTTTVK